jgi:hypothetical protein
MRSSTLIQLLAESRRCCILRVLSETPSYAGNESLLHVMVERFGFPSSRDQIRGDIAWLGEQGLVTVDTIEDCMVPTITTRGLDAAAGRITVPGVKRPEPR